MPIHDLHGKTVDGLSLLRRLSPGDEPHLIRNGILDFDNDGSTVDRFDFPVIIEECQLRSLRDGKAFSRTHFSKSFQIRQSTIVHDFEFLGCTFDDDFNMLIVELRGTLNIDCCKFDRVLPFFDRVHAHEKVMFRGLLGNRLHRLSQSRNTEQFQFHACRFHGGIEIEMPPSFPVDLIFSDSGFDQGTSSLISWSAEMESVLRLNSCFLAGRIFLEDDERKANVTLQIVDTSIVGELNLDSVFVEKMSLPRSSVPGGMLAMQLSQLMPKKAGRIRFVPGMRPGILADEKHLDSLQAKTNNTPQDKRSAEVVAREVAKEYGELRNAFQRAAHCGEHESFCHYKFKDYTRRAKEFAIGPAELRDWWIRGLAVLLLTLCVPVLLALESWLLSIGCLIFLLCYWYKFFQHWGAQKSREILRDIAWDLIILKWAGGYLVYLRSIIASGFALIVFFAIYNAIVVGCCRELGHDIQSNDKSIWPSSDATLGYFELAVRFFYYSAITFTTLGYGDYAPRGPLLQLVSSLEAFLGAVTLSLITVVLARKFVR